MLINELLYQAARCEPDLRFATPSQLLMRKMRDLNAY